MLPTDSQAQAQTQAHTHARALCGQFGAILGGHSRLEGAGCSVTRHRNIPLTILGRPSPGAAALAFTYESVDANGIALCLGEIAVLPHEINPILAILGKHRIAVSAIHNHWVHTSPNVLYLHFQSVDQPLAFAHKVSEIARLLQ
jgi:hypothetical protein